MVYCCVKKFKKTLFQTKETDWKALTNLPQKLIKMWMIFLKTKTEDVAVKSEVAFDGERDFDDLKDFRIFDVRPSQHGEASNIVGFWWRENRELHFFVTLNIHAESKTNDTSVISLITRWLR